MPTLSPNQSLSMIDAGVERIVFTTLVAADTVGMTRITSTSKNLEG